MRDVSQILEDIKEIDAAHYKWILEEIRRGEERARRRMAEEE